VGQISDLPAPVRPELRGFINIGEPLAHGDRLVTCGRLVMVIGLYGINESSST
jgi:hypothetical protein